MLRHYAPEAEGALRYDDPDIGIDWGLGGRRRSCRTRMPRRPRFAGFDSPFT
jgi:dTDP-4-dehydrorhamnose 3,5-epimerase